MKILFAGSPEAAQKTLQILYENQQNCGFEIAGVLSNPPSAKGRHKELIPTPVATFASEKNIPVFTPEHLDSGARENISVLNCDLLVCFAYGHIFGPKFLAMFPMGGINLHPSLLPKYRGCTPVPAAILNRDSQTAVTIQTVGLKMDEGNILEQEIVNLDNTETAESLLNFSAQKGAELICKLIKETVESGNGKIKEGIPQKGEASYTGIIKKEDGKINWDESAEIIEAKIRAYYPEPGCFAQEPVSNDVYQPLRILQACVVDKNNPKYSIYEKEENGKVLEFVKNEGIYIKTGDGILCAQILQRQGKKAMGHKDFMNGARNFIGCKLL